VIKAPTPWVWVIGRTQTNGPDDYSAVHAVQDGYLITPLHEQDYVIDMNQVTTTEPLRFVNAMSAVDFFTYSCEALLVNPPHATDFSMLARLSHLGIVPGKRLDRSRLEGMGAGVEAGARAAREAIVGNVTNFGTPVTAGRFQQRRSACTATPT
jgi:hypothetical protein